MPRQTSITSRFWSKVAPPDANGCLLWTGNRTQDGYGLFYTGPRGKPAVVASRWAYEETFGLIPKGLEVDHLCRVRHCVNVDHFEIVTHRVNTLRGLAPPALHARKEACPQGHPYDAVNTYKTALGARLCRTCAIRRSTAYTQKRRELRNAPRI